MLLFSSSYVPPPSFHLKKRGGGIQTHTCIGYSRARLIFINKRISRKVLEPSASSSCLTLSLSLFLFFRSLVLLKSSRPLFLSINSFPNRRADQEVLFFLNTHPVAAHHTPAISLMFYLVVEKKQKQRRYVLCRRAQQPKTIGHRLAPPAVVFDQREQTDTKVCSNNNNNAPRRYSSQDEAHYIWIETSTERRDGEKPFVSNRWERWA